MTAEQGFRLHPLAAQDITEIWEYIAVPFPNQGHKRPDLTSRPLRSILVREYLIAYAPEEKPLWVVAVMHGRRSPRVIAAILRGRE
jgi:plasmid stabilization system protein ParE